MKIPKPNRRSYKPHSAQATARRAAASQYNWAIHQLSGMLGHTREAEKIARTTLNLELIRELDTAHYAIRSALTMLRDPEVRKAWMATQEKY